MKRWVPFTLFLLTMIMVFPAQAAIFPVTDASELYAALTAASNNGQSDTIRVAQGTYVGNFSYNATTGENFDLILEGGWSSDFTARVLDPTNTILDGNRAGGVLSIQTNSVKASGSITVEGFTVRNGLINFGAGGIYISAFPPGTVTLNRNIIEKNETGDTGGGFLITNDDPVAKMGGPIYVTNNIIRKNVAASGTGGTSGGGRINPSNSLVISNNLIYGNVVGGNPSYYGSGGGLFIPVLGGSVQILNNTIVGNTAYTEGGGLRIGSFGISGYPAEVVQLSNNIIRDNVATNGSGDDIYNEISWNPGNSLTIAYSDFHDLFNSVGTYVTPTLVNNIDAGPRFVSTVDPDPLNWDLRLLRGSPCIDAGNNAAPGIPTEDLEGNPRLADGDGNGTAIVDMGAYESPIYKLILDFNSDGATDVAAFHLPSDQFFTDYSGNMGQYGWGGSAAYPLIWDYDGNGSTNISIYHIPTNQWFVKGVPGDNLGAFGWGADEAVPVPGDYDGNGVIERAFYHWPTNRWFIEGGGGSFTAYDFGWGGADSIPIAADYDGDGATDMMLYHMPSNQWFVYGIGNLGQFGWNGSECLPVPGDWDGDGKTEIGIYHWPTNQWFWRDQNGTDYFTGQYGWGGMQSFPIPGDYNGDGIMERAFYRPLENRWFIEGEADFVWGWDTSNFMPITSQINIYNWFRFVLGMFQ